MANLNTIKNWFRTGLKPTQAQFWETWDSFFHKDDKIPTTSIEGLEDRFDEKADQEALENHIADVNAHGIGNLIISSKTTIVVTEDLSIQWQTDLIEGDTRTYAQKHGNHPPIIEGVYEQDGLMINYKPGFNFTWSADTGFILTLNITEVFMGTITIL